MSSVMIAAMTNQTLKMIAQGTMLAMLVGVPAAKSNDARAETGLPGGLYAVGYRLELPHLERYAIPRSEIVCVEDAAPPPILSGNGAFENCRIEGLTRQGQSFRYELICPGRSGARAEADYTLTQDGFNGRIAVKLGAKNMTLAEIQAGRRLGPCPSG